MFFFICVQVCNSFRENFEILLENEKEEKFVNEKTANRILFYFEAELFQNLDIRCYSKEFFLNEANRIFNDYLVQDDGSECK